MFDWLFSKLRNTDKDLYPTIDYPRVMIWNGDDPDEWLAHWLESNNWRIPIEAKYVVLDLRNRKLWEHVDFLIYETMQISRNLAVIHDWEPSYTMDNVVFFHDDKRDDSERKKTVVSIHGDDPDGTMARVAQMMAINQTTIHGISYCSDGRMLDVVTVPLNGAVTIRVPDGEKAYLYDTRVSGDGELSGYAIYVDKDMRIPAEAMEMFKAIGELNAK